MGPIEPADGLSIPQFITKAFNDELKMADKYSFKSGFDAITACNATADALTHAVQDLIKVTVNHPAFASLFKQR